MGLNNVKNTYKPIVPHSKSKKGIYNKNDELRFVAVFNS